MIPSSEVRRRARKLGLQDSHVLSDYALNHVLAAITRSFPEFIFRGGTALARVYWPDFRLSEDLDFISHDAVPDLGERLNSTIEKVSNRIERELRFDFRDLKQGWSRSMVRSDFGDLIIDVNVGEKTHLQIEGRKIDLPYSDLNDGPQRLRCLALAEILGDKWYMLDDRKEPRDLYDLWAGVGRFGVPFEQIAQAHRAKYGFPPLRHSLLAARKLSGSWETRLAHQVAALPPINQVLEEVQKIFDVWNQLSVDPS